MIPERSWRKYKNHSEIPPQYTEVSEVTYGRARSGEILPKQPEGDEEPGGQNAGSEILHKELQETEQQDDFKGKEGFDTDFLIFPGDVYPNRKVKLEDAEITEETRRQFEDMCDRHPEAFSKKKAGPH